MKKLTVAFLALLFVFFPLAGLPFDLPVFAAESGTTGDCTWTLDGTVLTISGNGAMEDYTSQYSNGNYITSAPWGNAVTQVIIENGVTSIGSSAFYGCESLTSIAIPDSVTTIECSAFYKCTSLTSITIPDSVTTIGSYAFFGCISLDSIAIADGVTFIGSSAFHNTAWLNAQPDGVVYAGKVAYSVKGACPTIVHLKEDTIAIAGQAFFDCSSITFVSIPNRVTHIGESAFLNCESLISITIPDSVTSLGEYAFHGCKSLASVIIGKNLTRIDESMGAGSPLFSDCPSLVAIVVQQGNPVFHSDGNCMIQTSQKRLYAGCKTSVIPSDGSVLYIADHAFSGCQGLISVTIPDSIISIGTWAFEGCTDLISLTVGNGVTDLNSIAFAYCTSLESITLPESVTEIGPYTFSGCTSLTDVWYEGNSKNDIFFYEHEFEHDSFDCLFSANWHYNSCLKNPGNEKVHVYNGNCDADCNLCGKVRGVDADHIFDNNEDTDCNVCGFTKFTPGDLDGNPGVDMDDAIYLLFSISFPEDYPIHQPADYDDSGEVDMDDAIYLLFYTSFPEDYPLH